MNKIIMNDLIKSSKSIRQIPVSKIKKKVTVINDSNTIHTVRPELISNRQESRWSRKPLNPKFAIWLIAIVCLLALFFGISIIFSSAKIIVTPRTENITLNNNSYSAKLNPLNEADLSFEVMKISQINEQDIPATEEKEVNQKASGKIVIYNNYSTVSQRLINNTRFEANNGKIYRINSSVIIPGLKKIDGKTIPGSIEAIVYADQAGEDYNLKLADLTGDFKIPGFKGDQRYLGFYARLKEDIQGGFVGKKWIIAESVRKEAEGILKAKLNEDLIKKLYAIKPENYLVFKNSYSIDYSVLPDVSLENNKVKLNMQGDLNAVIFNNIKLSQYIAQKKITNFDNLPTELIPSDNLTVTFTAKDSNNLWKNSIIDVSFMGDAKIKWIYDTDSFKKDFAGKKEADFPSLVTKYKNSISKIEVMFSPVWNRYIPDKLNKITVQEQM